MTWQICIIHFEKDYAVLAVLVRKGSLSKVPNCVVDQSSVQNSFDVRTWFQNKQHLIILASLQAFMQVLAMYCTLVFYCAQ